MFTRTLKNEKGALYPISLVFFMSALILLSHGLSLYTVHYKTYDGLENMHRHATIQLLMEIQKNKIPEQ
ncbi:hypothetical protein NCCP2050_00590 [Planococcus sp. NCCP-2050]|jgi:hypothetical protein|nr:hypothetical protein NCCP2050_00590 [Planococcus sp. NCCP-2050]